jgi:predicted phosphoribosyltransferase
MRSAVAAVRAAGAARVVAATPLASPEAEALLRHEADEVVCLQTPDPFVAVGHWYQRFPQTEDEEVRALLQEAEARVAREARGAPDGGTA